jgi:hypothetical protein
MNPKGNETSGNDGVGDGSTGTTPAPTTAETTPVAPPTAGASAGNALEAGNAEAKFSQADLDRIAGKTRKEAKDAARAELLKELGVPDAEAAKAAIKLAADEAQRAEQARLAQMSETERMKAAMLDADKKVSEAEASRARAEEERVEALMLAEVVSKASGRFANPKAAAKLADLSGVKLEGEKFVGVDEALDALAQAEPWTLAANAPKPAPAVGPTNGKTPAKGGSASEEEMRATFFGGGKRQGVFDPKPDGVRVNR